MIPFALAYRLLIVRYPRLQWPDSVTAGLTRRELLPGAAGVLLALAPYAFFQLTFGTPSVIARDFNDTSFITGARLFSLFFDLNHGMIIGIPGVALALVIGLFTLPRAARAPWLIVFALLAGVIVLMALPALSTVNWNSGGVVMTRYSYWLGMPLVVLALLAARQSSPRAGMALLLAGAALQALLLTSTGLLGGKTLYSEHSLPARWRLTHFPRLYNPEAEIFHARTGKAVILPLPKDSVSVFRADGEPSKIMRHRSNRSASGGLCAAEEQLVGQHVRAVSREWEYLHAPFTCVAPAP